MRHTLWVQHLFDRSGSDSSASEKSLWQLYLAVAKIQILRARAADWIRVGSGLSRLRMGLARSAGSIECLWTIPAAAFGRVADSGLDCPRPGPSRALDGPLNSVVCRTGQDVQVSTNRRGGRARSAKQRVNGWKANHRWHLENATIRPEPDEDVILRRCSPGTKARSAERSSRVPTRQPSQARRAESNHKCRAS